MAGIFTYYFYDLASGTLLGIMPLKQVSFSTKLNQAGTFQGTLAMSDPDVKANDPVALTSTARTAVYVDRDGVLLWGGIIWKNSYQSLDQTMTIEAEDFETYFTRRVLYANKSYVAVDPVSIATDLVNYANSVPHGNIGIQVVAPSVSSQPVTQTWNVWDLKVISEAIADLAGANAAFDWAVDVAWSGGVPAISLTLSYPRRGRVAPDTGLLWEYPSGNVVSYTWPEDGTEVAAVTYAVGSGEGATMPISVHSNPTMMDNGYPLLEAVISHKDVTDPTTLDLYAQGDADLRRRPATLPVFSVRSDVEPVLGAYTKGDDCRVRITDPRFPAVAGVPGLDTYLRIQEVKVTPQDENAETVELTMGLIPDLS